MSKEAEYFFSKISRIPFWGIIAVAVLVVAIWLTGQLAFRNSMMEIAASAAFGNASAIVVDNKEVQDIVGDSVVLSLVLGDSKEGFFIAKVTGSKGYTYIKASYAGASITNLSLKIKDSRAIQVQEYLRGDWVVIKI